MKKVLAVILAAALLLCAFPASAFAVTADVPEGALQYEIRITDNPVDNTAPEWKEDVYSFYNSLGFEDVYMANGRAKL